MLAVMRDYFTEPGSAALAHHRPSTLADLEKRRAGQVIGSVAKTLLIAAAVILVVGGLVMIGLVVLFVVGLNQWASNK